MLSRKITAWVLTAAVGIAMYTAADVVSADGNRAIVPLMSVSAAETETDTEKIPIEVTLDPDGGECEAEILYAYTGEVYGALPVPTKADCVFVGWFDSDGIQATVDSVCTRTENYTLYAHWKSNVFTVTFNANGGKVDTATMSCKAETAVGTLPTPTRTGYTFVGWYTAKSGGTKITSSSVISDADDITLYAHWTANTYTITFAPNGGKVGTSTKKYTAGKAVGTLPTPTRTGYKFAGWYTAKSGGTKVTSTTVIKDIRDRTFYAHWTAKTYTIKFAPNGGKVSTASKTYTAGKAIGTLPTPTRTGYKFTGWYTAKSGGTKVTAKTVIKKLGNRTYYAHWSAKTYKITFAPNGGKVSTSTKKYTAGKAIGTLPTPTRTGYKFTGWYTAKSGGTKVTAKTVIKDIRNRTFYAHWSANTYTVKFNANGGIISSTSKSYVTGTKIGVLPLARKTGYTFVGWYTAKTGGVKISYTTVLSTPINRTFYARYARPSRENLRYSFTNSYEGFGYDSDYTIPYSVYTYMLGNKRGRWVYNQVGSSWGGNCFGMSATSIMMNTGLVKAQSFSRNICYIKQLKNSDYSSTYGMTVTEFIECMQIAQFDADIQTAFAENANDFAAISKKAKACQNGTGKPIVICITEGLTGSGHALVGYSMKKINSNTERVYVYDSNFPKNSNYVELYLENGEYVGFSYNDGMGDVYKTIYFDTISYFDFSMIWKIWQNRGSDNSSYGSTMLSVGSDNAVIYNSAGIICATITDGRLVSSAGGISRLTVDGDTDTSDNHLLNLPEGDYTVVDKDGGGIYVSLYDDGNVCEVTADSSAVKLSADESADVAISLSEGDNYEVKISTDSGDYTASGTADSDGTLKFVA